MVGAGPRAGAHCRAGVSRRRFGRRADGARLSCAGRARARGACHAGWPAGAVRFHSRLTRRAGTGPGRLGFTATGVVPVAAVPGCTGVDGAAQPDDRVADETWHTDFPTRPTGPRLSPGPFLSQNWERRGEWREALGGQRGPGVEILCASPARGLYGPSFLASAGWLLSAMAATHPMAPVASPWLQPNPQPQSK